MSKSIPDPRLGHARDMARLGHPLFCVAQGPEQWPSWKHATHHGNQRRLAVRRHTDALAAVLGRQVALVDVDPRNGGDTGLVARLLADCAAPVVALIDTGGGGEHHYVWKGDHRLRTRKNIMPGVDLLAEGSACFIPGGAPRDKHGGVRYEVRWSKLATMDSGHILDCSGFLDLLEWMRPPAKRAEAVSAPPTALSPSKGIRNPRAYVEGALRRAERQIMAAPPHGRNSVIHLTSHGIGGVLGYLRVDSVTIQRAEQRLVDAARQVGHHPSEVRSSLREGLRHPYLPRQRT